MCGIFAILNYPSNIDLHVRTKALSLSKLIRHRGPDWNGCLISKNNIFCHERLAIVGVESGSQPLTNADETVILSINGEIYNHIDLKKYLKGEVLLKSGSDCEIIVPLYEQLDVEFIPKLNGMFSFVLYDQKKDRHIVARDPIGITSLYWGSSKNYPGSRFYSSEMKSLQDICDEIHTFPPGHMYDSSIGKIVQYFKPDWFDVTHIPDKNPDLVALRESLELAVKRRLMSEVPFGVLLSGGLDSSLIASITVREVKKAFIDQFVYGGNVNKSGLGLNMAWPQVHSFSIGLPGSPDLKAAKEVADFIGTKHHGFTFTLQEAHDALSDVIYHLETYDVTTIRASTPMYLLSRKIKAMGVKMVLSGEGSDEIFAGYLYFHAAPTPEELHLETLDRVKNLHTADCLRANKSTMAWGLEARVPFLDVDFLQMVMNLKAEEKMFKIGGEKMEKYLIRKAFDTVENPYLPKNILWRQKEQFSDGVGYSWIDSLKNAAEKNVSNEDFSKRSEKWGYDTPESKEAYWYREMFDILFTNPNSQLTVKRWTPRVDWGCSSDPSGRAQKIHCDPNSN